MRRTAAGSFQHLTVIERQEFLVPSWPPWEGIDAIKSLDVIDPKEMKNAPDGADAFPPPLEIIRAHSVPAIERNAPVLPPFLRKGVVFEVRFGRRAAEPVEHEFPRVGKNVGAIITDAKRDIAH